jgi:hypothetical protein
VLFTVSGCMSFSFISLNLSSSALSFSNIVIFSCHFYFISYICYIS